MSGPKHRAVFRVDNYTRATLTLIAALLAVLVVGLWAERPSRVAQAQQAVKDSVPFYAQREALFRTADGAEKSAASLKRLVELFETGQAKAQVSSDDGKAPKAGDRPAAPK